VGSSAMQAFRRVEQAQRRVESVRPAARRSSVPVRRSARPSAKRASDAPTATRVATAPASPAGVHMEALRLVEARDFGKAARTLERLVREHPDYLAARMEYALVEDRRGHPRAADALARGVLEDALALAPDVVLEGPEPLTAKFYRDSAEAFLR